MSRILSTGEAAGCICLSACWDTHRPGQTPPCKQPPGQIPPPGRHPSTHPPQANTTRPDTLQQTATAADGTNPTGMHSCLYIKCQYLMLEYQIEKLNRTRMHSSRMRTVCCSSRLGWCVSRRVSTAGMCVPRGSAQGGCVYPSMHWGRHPLVNRMTERQV